jgi:aspartate racemase
MPALTDTRVAFPRAVPVHRLFAEHAVATPAAVAVALGADMLSYRDLNARANQVAHHLRSIGVGAESVVGLEAGRSLDMIVGMLGILKAGGAYLPLDASYPSERLAVILEQARVSFVVAPSKASGTFAAHGVRTISIDAEAASIGAQPESDPPCQVTGDNLAYVMFTSGSSGTPKGVGVVHRNITRLVKGANYVDITAADVFLQLSPVTFDAATFEIWGALLNGATLVLYPPEGRIDPAKLQSVIRDRRVTILWLTSSLFNRIVDEDPLVLSSIRQLLTGGDVVDAAHVRRLLQHAPGCQVINGYGPTEGTTFSVCYPVPDLSSIETTVPIGRPISNTTAYVLDSHFAPAPAGVSGELCIGGDGLARGYVNDPALTAQSFVPNPLGEAGSRLYRTGDVVRCSEAGVLEFRGRTDFQVKVHGYRVELEEVEQALMRCPGVLQAAAAVVPDSEGHKQLTGYVVVTNPELPDLNAIRRHLADRLPEYSMPPALVALKTLPLNENGKVDRKALPAPAWAVDRDVLNLPIEELLREIWTSVLRTEEVEIDDDFFDLGGTSLGLINVVAELSNRLGTPFETAIVTGGATIKDLSGAVRERLRAAAAPLVRQAPVEGALTEIWQSVLKVDAIDPSDDFFDLGGTSLGLINVVTTMSARFGIPLETSIVTGGATIRELARAVEEKLGLLALSSRLALHQPLAYSREMAC